MEIFRLTCIYSLYSFKITLYWNFALLPVYIINIHRWATESLVSQQRPVINKTSLKRMFHYVVSFELNYYSL
jgi:hypothetical protein